MLINHTSKTRGSNYYCLYNFSVWTSRKYIFLIKQTHKQQPIIFGLEMSVMHISILHPK